MITVRILSPTLTGCKSQKCEIFNKALYNELKLYTDDIIFLENKELLLGVEPGDNCAIVIYNSDKVIYDNDIERFIQYSKAGNVKIYPVALEIEFRIPANVVGEFQSFDVFDQLYRRRFSDEYIDIGLETAGKELARSIICDLQPVLSQKRMSCFLSHRRKDGEPIAAEIQYILKSWGEKAFRDVSDIKVGGNAQKTIENRLVESDTVIFIDTPDVNTSEWVRKEIDMAQSFHIPIVWVKMHTGDSFYKPSEKPHVVVEKSFKELTDMEKSKLVDDIYESSYKVHRMNAKRVLGYVSSLKYLKFLGEIEEFKLIDSIRNIYEIRIPRNVNRYREMPHRHFVQFFGRRPDIKDSYALNHDFVKQYYSCNNGCGDCFDTAILVGPYSYSATPAKVPQAITVDGAQEYISEVRRLINNKRIHEECTKNIIISGAFPEVVDAFYQQRLIDAVSIFSKMIFDRGCKLTFGAHPTFTPLILKMGEVRLGKARRDKINMYMSREYEDKYTKAEIDELKNSTSLFLVDRGKNSEESLTKMRRSMIKESNAAAIVVIGGKTSKDGKLSGVDEEIKLAHEADIPVFILGAAGGRAYEIAAECSRVEWDIKSCVPNGLQSCDNRKLLTSTDFEELADMILRNLGL